MERFNMNSGEEKIKHPFTVPENYFDNFSESFVAQLSKKERLPIARKATLWSKAAPWMYMAAMVAGVAVFFRFVTPLERDPYAEVVGLDHLSIKAALSDISEDEFFEIIEERARSVSYHQTMLSDSNY